MNAVGDPVAGRPNDCLPAPRPSVNEENRPWQSSGRAERTGVTHFPTGATDPAISPRTEFGSKRDKFPFRCPAHGQSVSGSYQRPSHSVTHGNRGNRSGCRRRVEECLQEMTDRADDEDDEDVDILLMQVTCSITLRPDRQTVCRFSVEGGTGVWDGTGTGTDRRDTAGHKENGQRRHWNSCPVRSLVACRPRPRWPASNTASSQPRGNFRRECSSLANRPNADNGRYTVQVHSRGSVASRLRGLRQALSDRAVPLPSQRETHAMQCPLARSLWPRSLLQSSLRARYALTSTAESAV